MVLPSLVLAGLLAVESAPPLFDPTAAVLEVAAAQRIKVGMREAQVERLLQERAGGTIYTGCGFAKRPWITRLYKRSKVFVTYEDGKVRSVSTWR